MREEGKEEDASAHEFLPSPSLSVHPRASFAWSRTAHDTHISQSGRTSLSSENAHAPVRVPRDARAADPCVGEERPEHVQREQHVRRRPHREPVELGRAAAVLGGGERRVGREGGRRGRRVRRWARAWAWTWARAWAWARARHGEQKRSSGSDGPLRVK